MSEPAVGQPGMHPPTPVREAATVILLRDGDEGLEAWLLTRVSQMAFAAGMTVFPGGRVDPTDADLPMGGQTLPHVLARLGGDEASSRALIGAAVRETFEETGVLLTSPPADLAGRRADVERHELTIADQLGENHLTIDVDAVVPWGRWVTPPGEARRYDTRFFAAELPAGAQAVTGTSEAVASGWVLAREALTQAESGHRKLLPPTVVTLATIAEHETVADVFAAAAGRSMAPIQPTLNVEGERVFADLGDGTRVEVPRSMFR